MRGTSYGTRDTLLLRVFILCCQSVLFCERRSRRTVYLLLFPRLYNSEHVSTEGVATVRVVFLARYYSGSEYSVPTGIEVEGRSDPPTSLCVLLPYTVHRVCKRTTGTHRATHAGRGRPAEGRPTILPDGLYPVSGISYYFLLSPWFSGPMPPKGTTPYFQI